jgi:hypothetical protein
MLPVAEGDGHDDALMKAEEAQTPWMRAQPQEQIRLNFGHLACCR